MISWICEYLVTKSEFFKVFEGELLIKSSEGNFSFKYSSYDGFVSEVQTGSDNFKDPSQNGVIFKRYFMRDC